MKKRLGLLLVMVLLVCGVVYAPVSLPSEESEPTEYGVRSTGLNAINVRYADNQWQVDGLKDGVRGFYAVGTQGLAHPNGFRVFTATELSFVNSFSQKTENQGVDQIRSLYQTIQDAGGVATFTLKPPGETTTNFVTTLDTVDAFSSAALAGTSITPPAYISPTEAAGQHLPSGTEYEQQYRVPTSTQPPLSSGELLTTERIAEINQDIGGNFPVSIGPGLTVVTDRPLADGSREITFSDGNTLTYQAGSGRAIQEIDGRTFIANLNAVDSNDIYTEQLFEPPTIYGEAIQPQTQADIDLVAGIQSALQFEEGQQIQILSTQLATSQTEEQRIQKLLADRIKTRDAENYDQNIANLQAGLEGVEDEEIIAQTEFLIAQLKQLRGVDEELIEGYRGQIEDLEEEIEAQQRSIAVQLESLAESYTDRRTYYDDLVTDIRDDFIDRRSTLESTYDPVQLGENLQTKTDEFNAVANIIRIRPTSLGGDPNVPENLLALRDSGNVEDLQKFNDFVNANPELYAALVALDLAELDKEDYDSALANLNDEERAKVQRTLDRREGELGDKQTALEFLTAQYLEEFGVEAFEDLPEEVKAALEKEAKERIAREAEVVIPTTPAQRQTQFEGYADTLGALLEAGGDLSLEGLSPEELAFVNLVRNDFEQRSYGELNNIYQLRQTGDYAEDIPPLIDKDGNFANIQDYLAFSGFTNREIAQLEEAWGDGEGNFREDIARQLNDQALYYDSFQTNAVTGERIIDENGDYILKGEDELTKEQQALLDKYENDDGTNPDFIEGPEIPDKLAAKIAKDKAEKKAYEASIEEIREGTFGFVFKSLGFVKEWMDAYNQFGGLARASSLFIDDDDIYGIKEEVHQAFCDSVLLGDPDCRAQAFCEVSPDHIVGGSSVIIGGKPSNMHPAAHIQGYAYPVVIEETINETTGQRKFATERLYQVTYSIRLVGDEEDSYNVHFFGPKRDVRLFPSTKPIGKGTSKNKNNPFVQYSKHRYTKVCLEFKKGILDYTGGRHRKLCTPIVSKTSVATNRVSRAADRPRQPGETANF